jgi:hypothetical protein
VSPDLIEESVLVVFFLSLLFFEQKSEHCQKPAYSKLSNDLLATFTCCREQTLDNQQK